MSDHTAVDDAPTRDRLPPAPTGVGALFDEVLKRPDLAVARLADDGWRSRALRLLAGSAVLVGLYGAAAGIFGGQVLLAAWKGPLIVAVSVVLCAPSLYVLAGIVGLELTGRELLGALAGFLATLGLLLVALLPIAWLFSVSSRSTSFVIWLHATLWTLAVLIAARFLGRLFAGRQGTLVLWILLLLLVSYQAATALRPVLMRAPNGPLFEPERRFFFEQLREIARAEPPAS